MKKSLREERKIAKKLGGRTYRGSGNLPWSKHDSATARGDISTIDLHIEHKRIEPSTKSLSVKREWLEKVTSGARRVSKVPSLVLHYEGAKGYAEDWLMMPLDVAQRLLAVLQEKD